MSWSHSSKLGLVAVAVLVLVATVGVASAVSVSEDAPPESEVGTSATVTVELEDLFADASSWQVNGQTELQDAQWTIELYQGDTLLDTYESSGDQPEPVALEESSTDADRVVVQISGTTPGEFSYSNDEPATFRAAEVVQVVGGEVNYLSELDTHHYTTGDPGSEEARTALDDADAAIQSAADDGSDVSDAESTFEEATTAYNNTEFANAVSLADEAQSQVSSGSGSDGSGSDGSSDGSSGSDGSGSDDSTDGSGDTNQSDSGGNTTQNGTDGGNESSDDGSGDADDGGLLWPILYGLFGLLILGGILGGVYWYQQQSQGPNRDPLG